MNNSSDQLPPYIPPAQNPPPPAGLHQPTQPPFTPSHPSNPPTKKARGLAKGCLVAIGSVVVSLVALVVVATVIVDTEQFQEFDERVSEQEALRDAEEREEALANSTIGAITGTETCVDPAGDIDIEDPLIGNVEGAEYLDIETAELVIEDDSIHFVMTVGGEIAETFDDATEPQPLNVQFAVAFETEDSRYFRDDADFISLNLAVEYRDGEWTSLAREFGALDLAALFGEPAGSFSIDRNVITAEFDIDEFAPMPATFEYSFVALALFESADGLNASISDSACVDASENGVIFPST